MKKCKRLLSICLTVIMLLGCIQSALAAGATNASTIKVATISDIRYQTGAADQDGLLISKSAALLDAAIEKVKASDADVLLVTGDLTNTGTLSSHRAVAAKLAEVQAEGVKVFVIPGEHDVKEGGTLTAITKADFESVYADFGYGESTQDPNSASYVADLGNGFKVVMSDSVAADGKGQLPQWAVDRAKAEVAGGSTVFAASHHPAVTRSSVDRVLIDLLHTLAGIDLNLLDGAIQIRPYTENPDVAAAQLGLVDRTCILSANGADPGALADAGVKFLFTGHGGSLSVSGTTTANGAQMYDIMSGSLVNASASVRYTTLSKASAGMKEQRAAFRTDRIASAAGVADVTKAAHDALAKQIPAEVDYAIEKVEAILRRILPQIHTYLNSFIDNLDVPALLDKVGGIADALMTIIKGPIGKDVIKEVKADIKNKIVSPLFSHLSVNNLHAVLADIRSALEQTDYNGNEFYSFLADIFTTIQKGDGKTPPSVQAIFDSLKAENPDVVNSIIRSFGSHFDSTRTVALINNLLSLGLSGSYAAGILKINFTVRQLLAGSTTILTPGDVTLDLWSADMLGGMYAANGQTVAEVVKPIINALLLGQDNANVAQTTQRFDAALQNPGVITHALFAFGIGGVLGDSIFAQGQSGALVARTITLAELGAYLDSLIPNSGVSSLNTADWAKVRDALNAAGRFTAEQLASVNTEFSADPYVTQLSKLQELANDGYYRQVAADFTAKVNALPAVEALTEANAGTVKALQSEYDAFYGGIQAYVPTATVEKLHAAYARILYLESFDPAVDAVIRQIDAIGAVTAESEPGIQAARAAYNALTIRQQKQVSNYQVLVDAEAALAVAKENAAAIADVEAKIAAIGTVENSPLCKARINTARNAFNALPAELQSLVSNAEVLLQAELDYDTLVNGEANQKAADAVIRQINAIGTVTLASLPRIEAAEAAYAALSPAAKQLVNNHEVLTAARAAYDALAAELAENQAAAQTAIDAISAIGDVTLASEPAIQAARAAYDALTQAQKALVSNYSALTAAESALDALKQAAVDAQAAAAVEALIDAIGEVTVESAEAIATARAAYNALTAGQKKLVANLAILTAAEAKLSVLNQDFLFEDGVTGITLRAGSGVVPEGTEMTVAQLAQGNAVYDSLLATGRYSKLYLYDISLAANGMAVAPDGTVTITIPQRALNTMVYAVAEDGALTPVNAALEGGSFRFDAEHVGLFALVREAAMIDTAKLAAAVAAYEQLDAASFDEAAFAEVTALYEAAKAMLENPPAYSAAAQQAADKAAVALYNAIAELEVKPAELTQLRKAILNAKKLKAEQYVEFEAVRTALANAEALLKETLDSSSQARIDAAAAALNDAIDALQYRPASFAAVEAALAAVPADLSGYTAASAAAVEAAVKAAQALQANTELDIRNQAEIDAAAKAVNDAVAALVAKDAPVADTARLALAVKLSGLYGEKDYTEESYGALLVAVDAGKALLAKNPSQVSQSEADAAAAAILSAISGLEWAASRNLLQRILSTAVRLVRTPALFF